MVAVTGGGSRVTLVPPRPSLAAMKCVPCREKQRKRVRDVAAVHCQYLCRGVVFRITLRAGYAKRRTPETAHREMRLAPAGCRYLALTTVPEYGDASSGTPRSSLPTSVAQRRDHSCLLPQIQQSKTKWRE